jgi:hypothetical protein
MIFIVIYLLLGPWNHVIFVGVGGYIGYHCNQWESDLLKVYL